MSMGGNPPLFTSDPIICKNAPNTIVRRNPNRLNIHGSNAVPTLDAIRKIVTSVSGWIYAVETTRTPSSSVPAPSFELYARDVIVAIGATDNPAQSDSRLRSDK